MQYSGSPQEHIASIFKEYTTPSRVLRSFTNLSNTVIQTALSGQCKFVFELLQNADDAFQVPNQDIEVKFVSYDKYLIVQHNGKGFDFNDVERICDYASQIEEVKATDLSKTGYKGLGFKSLFNLADCIYICSNGYLFRFDKTYFPDSESKPWQVIPIWCACDQLPTQSKFMYDQPVNIILKINETNNLGNQLKELLDQPELLLYLHRVNKITVNLDGKEHILERRVGIFGEFNRIEFFRNLLVASTWLTKTYERSVPMDLYRSVQSGNEFIYPDKIKKVTQVPFTFAVRSNEALLEISKVRGLCFNTLPTQLHLTLPYHVNSLFILNLDRTQLHENNWNEFLIHEISQLQLEFLKNLTEVKYLKNYVIELLVRNIIQPYRTFCDAFSNGFSEVKYQIRWLPSHKGYLLKLGEAWVDGIEFFKQNFQNIQDLNISPYIIDYNVRNQACLFSDEARQFTFAMLMENFPNKYYSQLTRDGYMSFITYLYKQSKDPTVNEVLKKFRFLKSKDGTLLCPVNAFLQDSKSIPHFLNLNPVAISEDIPKSEADAIKVWLVSLGAIRLMFPIDVLRESVLKWLNDRYFRTNISFLYILFKNHIEIVSYLAEAMCEFTMNETQILKENLLILTARNEFKLAKLCYLPDAVAIDELAGIISDDDKISPCYDLGHLREFFKLVGVHHNLNPLRVLRESILVWLKSGEIKQRLTKSNYKPFLEFVASHYIPNECLLTHVERSEFRKMPVLTSGQLFQEAHYCYFDSAIPNVKGLENVISNTELVSKNISESAFKFLKTIGVSEEIALVDVLRRSVIRWIREGDIRNKITIENHHDIINYIANNTLGLSSLKPTERDYLKEILILTKSGEFAPACRCYWATSSENRKSQVNPMVDTFISSKELVSSDYKSDEVKCLLQSLGVREPTFTPIYEKYSCHLKNVEWFFSELVSHWENSYNLENDELLTYLKEIFKTSCLLLAKNGRLYYSHELYSSQFIYMHDIDPDSVPLLAYKNLPYKLEEWLGFQTTLDLKCTVQLLQAFEKKPKIGEFKTRIFFGTLLQQLRLKDKREIKKWQICLLSKENKLKPAQDLYYFIEEEATCELESCYLKRIIGMSHSDTLELAELCGVHTIPFQLEVTLDVELYDNSLKEFYLRRVPFIAVQESRHLNENPITTSRRLYNAISSIELYKCYYIHMKYPFGNFIETQHFFSGFTLHTNVKWTKKRTPIHHHLKENFDIKTNIDCIIDMDEHISEDDRQGWLKHQKEEDRQTFYLIEEFIKRSNEEK